MRNDFTIQFDKRSSAFQQMQATLNQITTTHNPLMEDRWHEATRSADQTAGALFTSKKKENRRYT